MSSAPTCGFEDPAVAREYRDWYAGPGRLADYLERLLLEKLLAGITGVTTVLEVGCGTGHFTRWLADRGLKIVGVDRSAAMLAQSRRNRTPPCVQADARDLPFPNEAFDLAAMITSLEFIPDPERAVREAVRVARRGLLLGVLNRCSPLAAWSHAFGHRFLRAARFFTPWELEASVRQAVGGRRIALRWRTTLWPVPGMFDSSLPWGGFIGLCAEFGSVG